MRDMDTVTLTEDSRSPTGLAAVLGAGATWGQVNSTIGQLPTILELSRKIRESSHTNQGGLY